ncbi:hypothetical protein GGX14DRAFT_609873 [Mycena pura]|uniref:Uncharacterized protein n=1 Tax=Mycena pura TaxID=153505 RepID=A0AAD6VJK5_9AGAR|nr:hypothetical protein GGX14DRAFT_609873 [Mycena pura]
MQLYVICKSFYGCSASMLINVSMGFDAPVSHGNEPTARFSRDAKIGDLGDQMAASDQRTPRKGGSAVSGQTKKGRLATLEREMSELKQSMEEKPAVRPTSSDAERIVQQNILNEIRSGKTPPRAKSKQSAPPPIAVGSFLEQAINQAGGPPSDSSSSSSDDHQTFKGSESPLLGLARHGATSLSRCALIRSSHLIAEISDLGVT